MRLSVRFPDGGLVAEVLVQPDSIFAQDPERETFVVGSFTPGPAFPRVRVKLDAFQAVFDAGDLVRASALHEDIDRLDLRATDSEGRAFEVVNVVFQEGGLLFCAR